MTIRIRQELYDSLRRYSAEQGLTTTQVVTHLIRSRLGLVSIMGEIDESG